MLSYLDPGSGSLIVSAVVGGAAAAGVAVKQARARLTSRFSRKRPDEAPSAETSSGSETADSDDGATDDGATADSATADSATDDSATADAATRQG